MLQQPSAADDLRRRLVWLTLFRVIVITVLLGTTFFVTISEKDLMGTSARVLYVLVGATYVLTALYAFALKWHFPIVGLAYVQLVGDLAFATALIYISGGVESVFTFMFSLTIINAAILLHRRGAFLIAAVSCIFFGTIVLGQFYEVLPLTGLNKHDQLRETTFFYTLFVNTAGFFLIALLASTLAEQLRRAGERLRQSEYDLVRMEAFHERVVESLRSGLLIADHRGIVQYVNGAGARILGLDGDEAQRLVGEPARRLVELFDPVITADADPGPLSVEIMLPTGERRSLSVALSPFVSEAAERALGTIFAFEDRTELREMESAMRRSERLAAVGALAAGLAHELRNPLASISGSIELLSQGGAPIMESGDLMRIVLREIDRLNDLLENFLDYARPTPPQRQSVDLAGIIDETARVFRNAPDARNVELRVELQGPLFAHVDAAQIRQVLWNLLHNAAQATVERRPGGLVRILGRRERGDVAIEVVDSGSGVPVHLRERIFDPFFTTKERGSGLGLAAVHRIIEAHGGRVSLESTASGSRFSVVLEGSR